MKSAAIAFLFAATFALAGDVTWKQQSGRFATFQTPAAMTRDTNSRGIDTIMETYESPDVRLTFDSDVRVVPAPLQTQFERTVAAWIAQRKDDWRKSTYVDDGGAIHGSDHDPNDPPDSMPYYLYFGFGVGVGGTPATFAIHIRFRSLERLDDIERILKSIKFQTK